MIVSDILDKVRRINSLEDRHIQASLNANDFEELIDLICEYRDELLHKKVV